MTQSADRTLMRASAGVALSQYLARAMVVVRGVLAASVLGPQGFGGWNALNLILDYGFFAPAGSLQGLDLRLPAAVERGDRERARTLMSGAWSVTLAGGAGFVALLLLLQAGTGGASAIDAGAAGLMLVAAVLQLGVLYLASTLRAHGRFGAVSRGQSVQALLGGGLGLVLLWPWGIWGLIAGWIAGTIAGGAIMRGAAREAPFRPAAPREGLALVRVGLPIFGFYALSLLLRSTDRVAFVRLGAAEALGHYSLGLMASGLVLYLPESVGFVLFPRLAAAAQGARDAVATRGELMRAHRLLSVWLPVPVALAMIWAGPVIGAWLPEYVAGVPALHRLAFGSLLISVSTLPGYFLLAGEYRRRLLGLGAVAVILNAVLVFSVAARDPSPAAVAAASVAGYACFALGLVGAAAQVLFTGLARRLQFVFLSFLPALLVGGVALAALERWSEGSIRTSAIASAAVLVAAAPVLAWRSRRPAASSEF